MHRRCGSGPVPKSGVAGALERHRVEADLVAVGVFDAEQHPADRRALHTLVGVV